MSAYIKLSKEWKSFGKAIDVNFHKTTLEKYVGRATRANAIAVRRRVRQKIKDGDFEENAPLTTLFKKGSSQPLKGTKGSNLFNSIAYEIEDWRTAVVGVNRYNDDGYNIGLILHEGATIPVTEAMRNMFYLLWLAGLGAFDPDLLKGRAREIYDATNGAKGFLPIDPKTSYIRIPPRQFLTDTIKDPETINVIKTNWQRAVEATLRDQAKKGRRI